jgi:hypothetical protein
VAAFKRQLARLLRSEARCEACAAALLLALGAIGRRPVCEHHERWRRALAGR